MFDQLFKRASTRARHVTAPFAEERARYLDYCELRGDSRSLQLRKAHDLLWIASKLNSRLLGHHAHLRGGRPGNESESESARALRSAK